ncbi:unnamed protein product [Pseudo-nitzschia multistriata]|uniref:Uncharacterized protein n=1 Tax=Pseudo-nitzschia multistriata TaxID=183589 RepID=A0A448ZDQ6_9STRA|nr:unnamed protein product [Pseudo-nitzschia multistriata]
MPVNNKISQTTFFDDIIIVPIALEESLRVEFAFQLFFFDKISKLNVAGMIPSHCLVAKKYAIHFGTFDATNFFYRFFILSFQASCLIVGFLSKVVDCSPNLRKSSPVLGLDHECICSWDVFDIDSIARKYVIYFNRGTGVDPTHSSPLRSNEHQTQRATEVKYGQYLTIAITKVFQLESGKVTHVQLSSKDFFAEAFEQ